MPNSLYLSAPAKLNLFLHITGRRSDGYHELQTLFQLLDHGDKLELTRRNDSQLALHSDFAEVCAQDNLVYRAARMLQARADPNCGADIQLHKNLPSGGGLGGGSSDAATTLLGLNQLWQTGLNIDELASMGLQLGADVPVFIRGHSAWAEGIGEKLQPVELPEQYFLVIHPGVSVSTARIFSDKNLTRNSQAITIAAFLNRGGRNDCESVVKLAYPEVKNALEWLSGYGQAQLTGTGACIFASFASHKQAQAVKDQLPARWSGFVARGVNQSPLHQALGI